MNLNEIMETDHVIEVLEDGTVSDGPSGIYAPNLWDGDLDDPEWDFFSSGYTGQWGYRGPIMHDSESIGGRLQNDILDTPGYFAVVAGNYEVDGCPACGDHTDWCRGHGIIGDREGAIILSRHGLDDHDACHKDSSCQEPDPYIEGWAVVYRPSR